MAEQLLIGDVAAVTGIAAGRIRHYQKVGLLPIVRLGNGYRVFDTQQVLQLLRIDLLRSLGVGVADISGALHDEHVTVAAMLAEHRELLIMQRDRLSALISALDGQGGADDNQMLQSLATSHRHSIGVIGRLSSPLPQAAATVMKDLLEGWELPVPALFGQMLLPPAATSFMEQLSEAPGCPELFSRLRALAARVVSLAPQPGEAALLAEEWVTGQLAEPLPDDVVSVVRSFYFALVDEPVIVHGFQAWATSINQAAGQFLHYVADEATQHGVQALSVIILPK